MLKVKRSRLSCLLDEQAIFKRNHSATSSLGEASRHPTVISEACMDPFAELRPKFSKVEIYVREAL